MKVIGISPRLPTATYLRMESILSNSEKDKGLPIKTEQPNTKNPDNDSIDIKDILIKDNLSTDISENYNDVKVIEKDLILGLNENGEKIDVFNEIVCNDLLSSKEDEIEN